MARHAHVACLRTSLPRSLGQRGVKSGGVTFHGVVAAVKTSRMLASTPRAGGLRKLSGPFLALFAASTPESEARARGDGSNADTR